MNFRTSGVIATSNKKTDLSLRYSRLFLPHHSMLATARVRFSTTARRSFATAAAEKKYKVVVVGAGPGGLSGNNHLSKVNMTLDLMRIY